MKDIRDFNIKLKFSEASSIIGSLKELKSLRTSNKSETFAESKYSVIKSCL